MTNPSTRLSNSNMGAQALHNWNEEAANMLQWWSDAGVDMLVEDDPRDWLARVELPAAVTETLPAPAASVPDALPDTLEAFAAWRIGDEAPEARWHMPLATPQNVEQAKLMVVFDLPEGEAGESDRFLDPASSRLFDRMLAAVGLNREEVALTSLALARPATGQVPAADIGRLAEITRHHVSLIDPARVLLMGEAVNRALFGSESGTNRGNLHAINHQGRHFPTIASYHPRFLIRRPVAKADSWKHLQLLFGGIEK